MEQPIVRLNPSSKDISLVDAGTVFEDEKVWIGMKCCCRKKRFCNLMVWGAVIFDIISCIFMIILFLFLITGLSILTIDSNEKPYFRNVILAWFPIQFLLVLKLWYGIQYLKKGRTRQAFIPYYRVAVTYYYSVMISIIATLFPWFTDMNN